MPSLELTRCPCPWQMYKLPHGHTGQYLAEKSKTHNQTESHNHCSHTHTQALSFRASACHVWGCVMIYHTLYRWPHEEEEGKCKAVLSVSQHPSTIFLLLTSIHCHVFLLVSVDPTTVTAVHCIYEGCSETPCLSKVSAWPALMTFIFLKYSKHLFFPRCKQAVTFFSNWM